MVNYILFLRALLAHVDRLQALLGERWPAQLTRLNGLLNDLLSEPNKGALPARVNRIYRCFEGTVVETLVRSLFQQANEQAGHTDFDIRKTIVTDPTTQESRSVDLREAGVTQDMTNTGALLAAAHDLLQSTTEKALGNGEPNTQSSENHINAWISQQKDESTQAFEIGKRYTLNLGVGKEMVGSLITGKGATVPVKDLAGGGMQTEWAVCTSAFDVSSDDPSITFSTPKPNILRAAFSLWIPENGDSEVRQLFIVPRTRDGGQLEVQIYAVRTNERELYRTFTIDVPVEGSVSSAVPASGVVLSNEAILAPSNQMNLGTTHEWTTPPGRVMLTVIPRLQMVDVKVDLPNQHDNEFFDWYGEPATLSGPIENVRDAAEKFRNKWGTYLNDIKPQDLAERLSKFVPTDDWTQWESRADSGHATQWEHVSMSAELRNLAIHGHVLYEKVFRRREPLRTLMDSLAAGSRLDITWKVGAQGSVNVVPNVPWGLMYLLDPPAAGKAVDPMGFLALRFRLGYWGYQGVSGASKALGSIANAHQAYCLYWGNHPNDETGIEASWQRQRFQEWGNRVFVPEIPNSPNARDEVLAAFAAPKHSPTSVLYFFCQAAVGDGNKPILQFGPTSGLTDVLQTTDLLTGKDLDDRPLVFANACTTSSADPYVANLHQQELFQRGCRGFLGTETKVPIQLASRFADIFFHFFYRKASPAPMAAGEALAQTRLFLLAEYANIGGILYAYLNQYELYMADDSEVTALRM